MTDDLEERLSEALEQRGRVDSIEVHRVLDAVVLPGRRSTSGGLARLVAVVLVGGLAVGALAVGLSNRGVGVPPATPSGPVTASKTDGTFTLEMTADHGTYSPADAITVHTTLTYTGTPANVDVYGSGSGLVVFGVQQDGKDPVGGVQTDDLRPYAFVSGKPVDYPYTKSVGYVPGESGAAFAEQYYRDPLLHLPAGTWHIHAYFSGSIGVAVPSPHQLDVSVTVVVSDEQSALIPSAAPTQASSSPATTDPAVDPAAPLSASVTDGMFTLELTADHATYSVGDAIDARATLTYTGTPADVTVRASGSGLVVFWFQQDGKDPIHFPNLDDCHAYALTSAKPVEFPVADWFRDPLLQPMAPGTWHIHAEFYGFLDNCTAQAHHLDASVTVTVTDSQAVPTSSPDRTETAPSIEPDPAPSGLSPLP